MLKIPSCILLSIGLICCARKPAPSIAPDAAPVLKASPAPASAQPGAGPRKELQEILARVFQPVYFPFNQAILTPNARDLLAEAGAIMKREPSISIVIQGNTDDLGTVEYNLALGQKRAQAVKDYLVWIGVEASRLKVSSYGEEKPAKDGFEEHARAQNRRDEFVVSF